MCARVLLGLFLGTALPLFAAPAPDHERFLRELDTIPLGIEKIELLKRFPDLQRPTDLPAQSTVDALGREVSSVPPFTRQSFNFVEGRLNRIILYNDMRSMMTGGWEPGDASIRWGKTVVDAMRNQWGNPKYARSTPLMAMMNWEKQGRHLSLLFSPPAEMIAYAKKLGVPAQGMFALYITTSVPRTIEAMYQGRGKLKTEPFSDAVLDVDYAAYRREQEVEALPDTSRLLPDSLGKVFLGMPVAELRAARPALKADNFFNGRTTFYERPGALNPDLSYVAYSVRMDRIIRVEARPAMTAGAVARWCRKTWGEPSARVLLRSKDDLLADHITYVWRLGKANGLLQSGFVKGSKHSKIDGTEPQITVFHSNSELRHALHHDENEEVSMGEPESKRVWELLLRQP